MLSAGFAKEGALCEVSIILLKSISVQSRNYSFLQERKLVKLFSYVCNSKKIKELFKPT